MSLECHSCLTYELYTFLLFKYLLYNNICTYSIQYRFKYMYHSLIRKLPKRIYPKIKPMLVLKGLILFIRLIYNIIYLTTFLIIFWIKQLRKRINCCKGVLGYAKILLTRLNLLWKRGYHWALIFMYEYIK